MYSVAPRCIKGIISRRRYKSALEKACSLLLCNLPLKIHLKTDYSPKIGKNSPLATSMNIIKSF